MVRDFIISILTVKKYNSVDIWKNFHTAPIYDVKFPPVMIQHRIIWKIPSEFSIQDLYQFT